MGLTPIQWLWAAIRVAALGKTSWMVQDGFGNWVLTAFVVAALSYATAVATCPEIPQPRQRAVEWALILILAAAMGTFGYGVGGWPGLAVALSCEALLLLSGEPKASKK